MRATRSPTQYYKFIFTTVFRRLHWVRVFFLPNPGSIGPTTAPNPVSPFACAPLPAALVAGLACLRAPSQLHQFQFAHDRKLNNERRSAACRRFKREAAIVFLHDYRVRDCQPLARSLPHRFGREERIKYLGTD